MFDLALLLFGDTTELVSFVQLGRQFYYRPPIGIFYLVNSITLATSHCEQDTKNTPQVERLRVELEKNYQAKSQSFL